MDGHEGQQHEAGDRQVEHADALGANQRQLHVPGPLEAHEDVEQDREEDVLLHDVGRQAKARPVQPHVEVAVAVEVIRAYGCTNRDCSVASTTKFYELALPHPSFENVEVSHCMDDDEEDQEDGASRQTQAVVGDLDVLGGENGGADFLIPRSHNAKG